MPWATPEQQYTLAPLDDVRFFSTKDRKALNFNNRIRSASPSYYQRGSVRSHMALSEANYVAMRENARRYYDRCVQLQADLPAIFAEGLAHFERRLEGERQALESRLSGQDTLLAQRAAKSEELAEAQRLRNGGLHDQMLARKTKELETRKANQKEDYDYCMWAESIMQKRVEIWEAGDAEAIATAGTPIAWRKDDPVLTRECYESAKGMIGVYAKYASEIAGDIAKREAALKSFSVPEYKLRELDRQIGKLERWLNDWRNQPLSESQLEAADDTVVAMEDLYVDVMGDEDDEDHVDPMAFYQNWLASSRRGFEDLFPEFLD